MILMKPQTTFVLIVLAVLSVSTIHANAQFAAPLTGELVDYPVIQPGERSASQWRRGIGAWGESFSGEILRHRGFQEIREIKNPQGHGIDRVAIRRGSNGQIIDVRFVEVKTTRGAGRPRLGETRHGRQMSRKWLADKLRSMRASPDPETRRLARDVSRFRKQTRIPIERFGEVHEINTRTGRFVTRNPITGAELSNQSLERQLRNLQQRGTPQTRAWASRTLAEFDQIRGTKMSDWIGRGRAQQAVGVLHRQPPITRRLIRAAGPIGAAIAFTFDARELYSHRVAYLEGRISREQYVRRMSESGGGIGGAFGGGAGGAWIGMKIGTLGGPFVWITVPAGVIIGGGVGGVAGYFLGSAGGAAIADAWYSRLDENVKESLDHWVLATTLSGK